MMRPPVLPFLLAVTVLLASCSFPFGSDTAFGNLGVFLSVTEAPDGTADLSAAVTIRHRWFGLERVEEIHLSSGVGQRLFTGLAEGKWKIEIDVLKAGASIGGGSAVVDIAAAGMHAENIAVTLDTGGGAALAFGKKPSITAVGDTMFAVEFVDDGGGYQGRDSFRFAGTVTEGELGGIGILTESSRQGFSSVFTDGTRVHASWGDPDGRFDFDYSGSSTKLFGTFLLDASGFAAPFPDLIDYESIGTGGGSMITFPTHDSPVAFGAGLTVEWYLDGDENLESLGVVYASEDGTNFYAVPVEPSIDTVIIPGTAIQTPGTGYCLVFAFDREVTAAHWTEVKARIPGAADSKDLIRRIIEGLASQELDIDLMLIIIRRVQIYI